MISELLTMTNWWEPGTAGTLDVGDIAAILALVTASIGTFAALGRWWMKQLRNTIHEEVEEYTQAIQPNANGGYSLPDVSRKVEKLESSIETVKKDLREDTGRLEKSVDELKQENRDTWQLLLKHLMKNDGNS